MHELFNYRYFAASLSQMRQNPPKTYEPYVASAQNNLSRLYAAKNDFAKAEAATLEALEIYKRLIKVRPQPRQLNLEQQLSSCYGNLSWYLLFTLKFNEAEQAARSGLAISSTHIWIKTNLAYSLILQGKYEDALIVYQELKSVKNEGGKSYSEICLEDLDTLEKAGVTHKDVGKIRDFLRQ